MLKIKSKVCDISITELVIVCSIASDNNLSRALSFDPVFATMRYLCDYIKV